MAGSRDLRLHQQCGVSKLNILHARTGRGEHIPQSGLKKTKTR